MNKFKQNKKIISIIGIVLICIIGIVSYKEYQQHQNALVREAVKKVCTSTPPLAGTFKDYQIESIDAHKKVINHSNE